MKVWNDFTKEMLDMASSATIAQMRRPGAYYVISDAQLKRDLKGRTLKDIYADNHALGCLQDAARNEEKSWQRPTKIDPLLAADTAYRAWCAERKHTPHPASIDPEHPIAKQREGLRFVKREG